MEPQKPTLCFATMCKNEEHCIQETLESVYKYIDYWVVCDTGSTDRTCEIVTEFFKEKGIPGELIIDEWKGFDVNKTLLFERCYKKTDYLIHLDADDLLVGDFEFNASDAGGLSYMITVCRGGSTKYKCQGIFYNRVHWKFCGVAHTTIRCLDNVENRQDYDLSSKNFMVISRDTGSRSNDPEKYYKDALRLTDQFFSTLFEDPDNLNTRSVFYTAQSYLDSHKYEQAIQWNSLYLRLKDTWIEETFECCLRIAVCCSYLNYSMSLVEKYVHKAIDIFRDRAEPYIFYGKYLNHNKKYEKAYYYLSEAKKLDLANAKKKYILFVNERAYGKFLNDELSVSCYWLGRFQEGMDLLKEIIDDNDFSHEKERLQKNMDFFNEKLGI